MTSLTIGFSHDAFQAQFLPPPSYRQDEVQIDELAGVRGWSSSAWQPDTLDDAGGTVFLVGAEAHDAWRPPRYSDLAIETALTLWLVFGLPLRQTEGFVTSVLNLIGLDLPVPDHTTLSRRANKPRAPKRRHDDGTP